MDNYTFPPQSNRGDWNWTYEAYAEDGTEIDLDAISGLVIKLQLHAPRETGRRDYGAIWWNNEPALSVTTPDSQIVIDGSTFSVSIPAASLDDLCAGAYHVSVVMTDGTSTAQLLLGTLPLIEGYST